MTKYFQIIRGDVLEVLPRLPENSFDACLSDPPYGLKFQGKSWDGTVPPADVWSHVHRLLKPGAHLLACGATRTFHQLVTAIEASDFEIRDAISWIYGEGFPKSLDASKAIDAARGLERPVVGSRTFTGNAAKVGAGGFGGSVGVDFRAEEGFQARAEVPITGPACEESALYTGYGTALKPAQELISLARKPLIGTLAENIAAFGTGALAIDATRIEGPKAKAPTSRGDSAPGFTASKHLGGDDSLGRWPANVILDEEAGAVLDAQTGVLKSGKMKTRPSNGQFTNGEVAVSSVDTYGDSGGASRFFYCAKAKVGEREAGLDAAGVPVAGSGAQILGREDGSAGLANPRAGAGRSSRGLRNPHPTVKPLALMEYLAKLILPPRPGAVAIVPFSGVGSEMIGALLAGFDAVVGVELDGEGDDYVRIAKARIRHFVPGAVEVAAFG